MPTALFVLLAATSAATVAAEDAPLRLFFVFLATILLVAVWRYASLLARRLVIATTTIVIAIAVVAPPRDSQDAYAYAMYGRILAHHHHNPYDTTPSQFANDRLFTEFPQFWKNEPSVYGPLFTVVSAGASPITGDSPGRSSATYQLIAALCLIASAELLRRNFPKLGVLPWLLLLHPVVLLSTINGGHADALVVLLTVLFLGALRKRSLILAGACAVGMLTIKATAALIILGALWWMWNTIRKQTVIGWALAVGIISLLTYLAFGLVALDALRGAADRASSGSIFHVLWQGLPFGTSGERWRGFGTSGFIHSPVVTLVPLMAFLIVVFRRVRGLSSATFISTIGLLLLGSYILPWYFVLLFPVVLFVDFRAALLAHIGASALLVGYFVFSPGFSDTGYRLLRDLLQGVVPLGFIAIAGIYAWRYGVQDHVLDQPFASNADNVIDEQPALR